MLLPQQFRTQAWQAALAVVDRMPRLRSQRARPQHLETGEWGEEAAFFHLGRCGFTVIAKGWRSGRAPGDLDLVAWDEDVLCFVEVKTRSSRAVATAESAVDYGKRHTLRRLARHYLRQFPEDTPSRFDVLSVYRTPGQSPRKVQFEIFRNAFGWQEGRR